MNLRGVTVLCCWLYIQVDLRQDAYITLHSTLDLAYGLMKSERLDNGADGGVISCERDSDIDDKDTAFRSLTVSHVPRFVTFLFHSRPLGLLSSPPLSV